MDVFKTFKIKVFYLDYSSSIGGQFGVTLKTDLQDVFQDVEKRLKMLVNVLKNVLKVSFQGSIKLSPYTTK